MIIILCSQLEISSSKYNLYKSEESSMVNVFDNNCLYFICNDQLNSYRGLIEFCIRGEILNDQSKFCYGKVITFKQLKLINVSINDLFQWNVIIERIDLYSKYLLSSNLIYDNESFCNCFFFITIWKIL